MLSSGWPASSAVTRSVSLVTADRPDRGGVLLAGKLGDHLRQLGGVHQVAVVAERQRALGGGPEGRLGVLPHGGAGGGVAGVPDGDMAEQRAQGGFVEDLRDQTHVLVDEDLGAVAHCDTGGLLSAVLQGVQPEVGEFGDLFTGGPDTEDTAGILGALLAGKEVMAESSVTAWHMTESRAVADQWRNGGRSAGHRGSRDTRRPDPSGLSPSLGVVPRGRSAPRWP